MYGELDLLIFISERVTMKRCIYNKYYDCQLVGFVDLNTAHIVLDSLGEGDKYVDISTISDIRHDFVWDFSAGGVVLDFISDKYLIQISPDSVVAVEPNLFKVMNTNFIVKTIKSTRYLVDVINNNKVNLALTWHNDSNDIISASQILMSLYMCANCTDCVSCSFCEDCTSCTDCTHLVGQNNQINAHMDYANNTIINYRRG